MTNYELLKDACKNVVDRKYQTLNMLNIKDFRKTYTSLLRKEENLTFFKYFPPKWYANENLLSDVLVCNNPRKFNDVFEGMVISLDIDEASEVHRIIDEVCNSVSISCFSETWDNLLMYAHYADSYRGFCVEYDFTKIINEYPYFYFFPVLYQSSPHSLTQMRKLNEDICNVKSAYNQGNFFLEKTDEIISYFIHKAEVWSYEREWRFIIPITQFRNYFRGDDVSEEIHFLNNFDCVVSVYLAPNIDSCYRKKICETIKTKNSVRIAKGEKKIKIYQTKISEKAYSLVPTLING